MFRIDLLVKSKSKCGVFWFKKLEIEEKEKKKIGTVKELIQQFFYRLSKQMKRKCISKEKFKMAWMRNNCGISETISVYET